MNDAPALNLPIASPALLFVGTLGRIFIWSGLAAFIVGLFQALVLPRLTKLGSAMAVMGGLSVISAFATLGSLLVRNQYEFRYVFEHSQATDPLQYKIAAIWSGQEGSFLLWATTSSIFLLLTLWGTGAYRRWFSAAYFAFLGALCGILSYESPFVVQLFHGGAYIPPTGLGLNASLQNYWLVIHPPTIFTGFGSLTVLFAYGFAALVMRSYKDWVPQVRPWALVSLSVLGIGLCMGGFWAYETLGWGGFWKWDPVENVSFVPWIMTAALIHGFIVQGTRGRWMTSNLLLGGIPFLLFVYGTFLTRAGFLDGVSVHSFAEMEHTAHMVLLTFCVTAAVGYIGLWAFRALKDPLLQSEPDTLNRRRSARSDAFDRGLAPRDAEALGTNREGWYRFGSLLLCLTGIATAVGMSVPLFLVIAHKPPKVVEEHLYHLVLVWFFVPIMFGMAVAPFVSWRSIGALKLLERMFNVLSITVGVLGICMLVMNNSEHGVHMLQGSTIDFPFGIKISSLPWVIFLLGFCTFTIVANLWRVVELRRAQKSSLGSFVAHIGVAVAMAGLITSRGLERTQRYALQEQDIAAPLANVDESGNVLSGQILPYTIMLHEVDPSGMQDKDNKLHMDVHGVTESFEAAPGFYFRTENGEQKQMAWPFIHHELSHDTYIALGGQQIQAGDAQTLSSGETKTFKETDPQSGAVLPYRLTYEKMEMVGQPGQPGTKFIAYVQVQVPNGTKLLVKPSIVIGEQGGPLMQPVLVDSDYFITMMRMDAATKSVTLQMNYTRPLYWADLMYKPLVGLVPLGAGIMTLGGLMAAWYRRKKKKQTYTEPAENPDEAPRETCASFSS